MRRFQTGGSKLYVRLSDLTLCLLSLTQLYCALISAGERELNQCRDKCTSPRCLLQTPTPCGEPTFRAANEGARKKTKIMTFWGGFNTGRRVATSHVPWMECDAKTSWPRRRKTSPFPALLAFFIPLPLSLYTFFLFALFPPGACFVIVPFPIRFFIVVCFFLFIKPAVHFITINHAIWYRRVDFPS